MTKSLFPQLCACSFHPVRTALLSATYMVHQFHHSGMDICESFTPFHQLRKASTMCANPRNVNIPLPVPPPCYVASQATPKGSKRSVLKGPQPKPNGVPRAVRSCRILTQTPAFSYSWFYSLNSKTMGFAWAVGTTEIFGPSWTFSLGGWCDAHLWWHGCNRGANGLCLGSTRLGAGPFDIQNHDQTCDQFEGTQKVPLVSETRSSHYENQTVLLEPAIYLVKYVTRTTETWITYLYG